MTKPDYSLTANLTYPQKPQTLSVLVTLGLDLRIVGSEAARAVGMNIQDVNVEVGSDALDQPALFFNYQIPPGDAVTGKTRSRLLAELRDRLLEHGDSRYPYVRLTSP